MISDVDDFFICPFAIYMTSIQVFCLVFNWIVRVQLYEYL